MAGHLEVLNAAITALPPAFRRRLMVICDGASASQGPIERLDEPAGRRRRTSSGGKSAESA